MLKNKLIRHGIDNEGNEARADGHAVLAAGGWVEF
jgi:hypothetical protein